MQTSFTRNPEAAKATDASATIRDAGKYVVVIQEADTYTFHTNAGAELQFIRLLVANDKKERQTIELCVDGAQSDWQLKQFHSLLTCAHVDNCNFVPAKIKAHRRGVLEKDEKQGLRCRELEGKKIGVLFQELLRDFVNQEGEVVEFKDLQVARFFDAETEQTASEIIGGKPAANLASAVANLKVRDMRQHKGETRTAPKAQSSTNDFDDNPF